MRAHGNSLDLNNFPEDYYTRDAIQASGDSSSSAGGYRKKNSGDKEEKDEAGKEYECRFCSLKFCKSQALGGHMNRHRQERETETLNKARQLVFSNDLAPAHLGSVSSCVQPISNGGFHRASHINIDDTSSPFRSIYSSRMFSTSSLLPPAPSPPQTASYAYPSHPQLLPVRSPYQAAPPANNYYVGHVVANSCSGAAPNGSYYTSIGARVGQGLSNGGGSSRGQDSDGGNVRDLSLHNLEEGRNRGWR